MPRVAILAKTMDEQDRRARSTRVRGKTLAHHREGNGTARDDDLLHERGALVPVDDLLGDA